jgi:hypothetical protein
MAVGSKIHGATTFAFPGLRIKQFSAKICYYLLLSFEFLNKGRSNGLGIGRHVQLKRLIQLRRDQHWWFLHVLLDLIESLLLFVAPCELLILF